MKKKVLFTAFLALGLALTGCGKTDNPSTSDNPNSSDSSSTLVRIDGNGTDWVDSIKALLNQAYEVVGDDSIAVPYVDAKYYYADFNHKSYKDNQNVEATATDIYAFDSETASVTKEKRDQFMNSYADHYSSKGFTIDKSNFSNTGTWFATKVMHGTKLMYVEFGTAIIGSIDELTPLEGLLISVGVQQYVTTTGGFVGDNLEEWPTETIEEVLGVDLYHPTYEDESSISYFGGWNVLPGNDGEGNEILIDSYFLNCSGASETDYKNYMKLFEDAKFQMLTDDDTGEVYGIYNAITGVFAQIVYYAPEPGYLDGIIILAYVATEPFEKSETSPIETSSLPEYTEEGKTFTYYYSSRVITDEEGQFTLHTLLISGVSDNAVETYKTLLEANGFTVTPGKDEDGNNVENYYIAQKQIGNGVIFFHFTIDTYPDVGQCLTFYLFSN